MNKDATVQSGTDGVSQNRANPRGKRGRRPKKGDGEDRMATIQALLSAERYFVVVATGEETGVFSNWG